MATSARLVVRMTPKEKRALEGRAQRAGLSTSEFVRQWVITADLTEHREDIEALLATLEASPPAILASVKGALATASKLNTKLDAVQP